MAKKKPPGVKNGEAYAVELKDMPDHSNDNVRAAEAKIGPFIYDEPEDSEDDRR